MTNQAAHSVKEIITDRIIPQKLKDKMKILIVEDNLLSQKVVAFMLKEWGFKFNVTANGKLAIEHLKKHPYDLILMDIQMPELDGFKTTEYIRNKLNIELPIIGMSAHPIPGERNKCLKAGMNDYIEKPINEMELFNLVNNYLFSSVVKTEEV